MRLKWIRTRKLWPFYDFLTLHVNRCEVFEGRLFRIWIYGMKMAFWRATMCRKWKSNSLTVYSNSLEVCSMQNKGDTIELVMVCKWTWNGHNCACAVMHEWFWKIKYKVHNNGWLRWCVPNLEGVGWGTKPG